jgi:hypothetical protein
MEYGESALSDTPSQLTRYHQAVNRLWRDREVIRYDPDRGLYASPAHEDELNPPRVLELEDHYYVRHPDQLSQRDVKNT